MSKRIITFWQEEFEKSDDVTKVLKDMGMTYFRRMVKHPDELKVQFQAISEINNEAIADRLRKDHEYYVDFFEKVLKKGIRKGAIRKDFDVRTVAWIYNGMGILMNLAMLLNFKDEFNEKMVSRITDYWIEMMKA